MGTSKFKTTIKCAGCIAKATPFLNEAFGETKWEVDISSPSKVLTVKGEQDKDKIIKVVEKAGFKAEVI
ncbi:heavy-metal-associated domain-containing protein [Chryseosolibacter indicus]|uniref:Heavy metal transport/detoxification protein n=1 Tax=Chryseosolibacter indicus TaxID=2782351 RepID=A0ABS5VUU2_9BACT|nr:heavy metal transport/detoxification protein [Chryseosolibacter indicus]MBT1704524.1 heavy metal transport/detoxification protein [Chryseosolibacter indicus]